jgi:RNA polymerase-binding protein DksA
MSYTIDAGLAPSQRERLRARLVADRASATDLIGMLKGTLDAFNAAQRGVFSDDEHDPEGPSIAIQRSEATALLAQSRRHLDEVNAAVARLDSDAYGVCENCGRDIPFARLEARPHARHCINCAEKLG